MKPYQQVPIKESGEPLVSIPLEQFAFVAPHPYVELGAPYGKFSPYFLREGVLRQLFSAQEHLQKQYPSWRLQIFDAYRPISVQQFMVDYTFDQLAHSKGLDTKSLSEETRSLLHSKVVEFWALPSPNPATPPPHSTGAAVDLTLVNGEGIPVDMGSAIDEISPRSYPNHFDSGRSDANFSKTERLKVQQYHHHRSLLAEAMSAAGFQQHPNEWWHFSSGDQLWAWQVGRGAIARYGNAQLV